MSDDAPKKKWDTWHMEPYFKPIGGFGGSPWISIHINRGDNLPVLGEGFIGLEFDEDVKSEDVRALQALLSRLVRHVTYTGPIDPTWPPGRGGTANQVGDAIAKTLQRIAKDGPRKDGEE